MHGTKAPTKSEKARMAKVAALGCICCRLLEGREGELPVAEIHHLLECGRRRGHRFTVGLCFFHHRGVVPYGLCKQGAVESLGPSLADGTVPFRRRWGSDDFLLEMTDRLISSEPSPAGRESRS